MPVYKTYNDSGQTLYTDRPGRQLAIPLSMEGLGDSDSTPSSSTYISPDDGQPSADDLLAGAKQTLSKLDLADAGRHVPSAEDYTPAPRTWGDTAVGAIKGAGRGVVDSLYGMGHALMHPIDTLGDLTEARGRLSEKAVNAESLPERIGYGVASGIPIFGPMLAGLGEEIGTGDPENIGHAVGEMGTAALAPEILPRSLKALSPVVDAIREADVGVPIRAMGRGIERTGSAIKNTLGSESPIGSKMEAASPYAFISGHPGAGLTGMFGPSLAGKLGELGEFLGGKMKSVGEGAPEFEAHAPNRSGYSGEPVPDAPSSGPSLAGPGTDPHAPNVSGYPTLDQVRESIANEAPSSGPSLAGPQFEQYAPNTSGYHSLDQVKEILRQESGMTTPEQLGQAGIAHFRTGANLPGMMPSEISDAGVEGDFAFPKKWPFVKESAPEITSSFGETTGRPHELPPPRSSTVFSPQEEPTAEGVQDLVKDLVPQPKPEGGTTLPPSLRLLERGDEFWGPGSKSRGGKTAMADESNRVLYDPQTPTSYIRHQLSHATTPQDQDFLVRALRQRYNIHKRASAR